jgi:cation diffusion facilitator family transporter
MTDLRPGLRISLFGMAASAALATVKLVSGIVGHSAALVADAVESFSDVASSAIVWGGLAVSARPPDDNHPYGHGKAEPLATLAVGLLLIGAAVGIVAGAIREILAPHHAPAPFTLFVIGGVIIVKETMFRISVSVGRRIHSTAVTADAWHHRSDAITSLIAAIGISISILFGPAYEVADDWAAIAASLVIVFNGTRFTREALLELMDTQPGPDFLADVTDAAAAVPGVRHVEKVLARKMGTVYLVDMHIEVDGHMRLDDAHRLAHAVKDKVRAEVRRVYDVLVHVEPHE